MLTMTVAASPVDVGFGQKKQAQCEQSSRSVRNWELIGQFYVYFDSVLCPASADPQNPLVRVWITTRGNQYAIEKWAQDRNGADVISMFHDNKQIYTLYRDLNAVPLTMFKAERRAAVPVHMGNQSFLLEGFNLIPLEKLTPDSVAIVKRVFKNADIIIKTAQDKVPLLSEAPRLAAVAEALTELHHSRK